MFAVNGGLGCGDSSSPSGGSEKSSGASHSKGSGTYSVSGIGMLNNNSHTSSSSSSSGGSCSGGSGSNVKSSYVREFDMVVMRTILQCSFIRMNHININQESTEK